jgi:predicted CoA-binding protein
MAEQQQIDAFLDGKPHAVVGASTNRDKYGNKVLRVYMQNDRPAFPINPKAGEVEGLKAYPDLESLPNKPHGVSIITPPDVSKSILEQAAKLGIGHVWMQPGAEFEGAERRGDELGINVIADGSCILVVLGYREH